VAAPATTRAEPTARQSVPTACFGPGRLGFHLNLGSGLPVGHLGGTMSVDLVSVVFLEAGAGVSSRGLQIAAGAGGRIFLERGLTLNVGVLYSHDEGLAPVTHDAPDSPPGSTHWLTPTLQLEGRGQNGFVVRGEAGAGVVLEGDPSEAGRVVLALGVTVGFWL
jgi:hypothetical protein